MPPRPGAPGYEEFIAHRELVENGDPSVGGGKAAMTHRSGSLGSILFEKKPKPQPPPAPPPAEAAAPANAANTQGGLY